MGYDGSEKEATQIHEKNAVSSEYNELRATDEMCLHCFNVLVKHILKKEPIASEDVDFLHRLSPDITCPLFVTWDIRKMKSKFVGSIENQESDDLNELYALRGCIGSLSPKTLKSALGEYALASALRDQRFLPVALNEVPFLRVAVSLLVQYEECNHVHDWEVGKHGIIINFSTADNSYSATYLPEVAREQGWTQQRTIESLVRKAGFYGALSLELLCEIKCTRYQSSKQKLSFSKYISLLGHDPIQQTINGNPHASFRNRTWKDIFHR